MKTKILHVIGGLNAGGAETAVVNWLKNIDHKKYQFDFAVHTSHDFYSTEVKKMGCRIHTLPDPTKKGVYTWIKSFENLLSRNKYDVIHSHLYFFNGFVLRSAFKSKVKIRISHSHNEKSIADNNTLKFFYKLYARYLIKKYATNLVGCSKGSLKNLYSNIPIGDKRLSVIHNGIDLSKFKNKKPKKLLRKKYGIPINKHVYLHIGRFTPVKNHIFLIKTFEEILKKDKNSKLVLIGDGELRKRFEKMVKLKKMDDKIHFLGLTDKVSEWMRLADIFLLPSLFEGLPVTLIEAQASGLNCLISDRITSEIDAGLGLVKFASLDLSPEIWAKKSINIIAKRSKAKDIEKAMRKKGFDISSVCLKLEKIYDRSGEK